MSTPLVSIITTVYNANVTLEATIKSVLDQERNLFEYWIIDGGSTDGSLETIQKYSNHLAGWVSEPDKGIYDAMNKGLDRACGKWIFFLGADDVLMPNCIKSLATYLDSDIDLIFGKVIFTNNRIVKSFLNNRTILQNTLHHQSALYNKKLFVNFRYDTSFSILSDYELNLILFTNKCNYKEVDLLISRCSENGASSNVEISIFETNRIRKKYINNEFVNILLSNILVLYYRQKKYRSSLTKFFKFKNDK
jgi:glycosyltransferase involved in cell wall biosynthesis